MSGFRGRIRDLTFEGGDGGVGFFIEDVTGWLERPDMRRDSKKRQQAAGSHRAPGFSEDRLIVIDGECVTESPEQQAHFARRLSGLLEDGEYARLTIDHESTTLWCDVGLQSQSFDIDVYGTHAMFQVQFLAPDPYIYGDVHRYPATGTAAPGAEVPVWHYGNARAYPRFDVYGLASGGITEDYAVYGPTVAGTRKRYKVNGALAAGVTNTIDLSTGICNGPAGIRRGVVEDATTWGVPGGVTVSHSLDSNGDPAGFVAYITDTFI